MSSNSYKISIKIIISFIIRNCGTCTCCWRCCYKGWNRKICCNNSFTIRKSWRCIKCSCCCCTSSSTTSNSYCRCWCISRTGRCYIYSNNILLFYLLYYNVVHLGGTRMLMFGLYCILENYLIYHNVYLIDCIHN